MASLEVGDKAPPFTLENEAGERISLAGFVGAPVVLFFYPEDDTPGCTAQACSFRDESAAFRDLGATVLGISQDSVESHVAFKKKYGLPYSLLSDPGNKVAMKYESYGKKILYGNEVVGTIRSSIIIDARGRIAGIFRNVRTEGNGERMVKALRDIVTKA